MVCTVLLMGAAGQVMAEPTHPCGAQADPGERLACYDRAFGAPETAAQRAAATARAKEDFGLEREAQRERVRVSQAEADVDQIESPISKIGTAPAGERLLTLDNGQRWMILDRGIRGPLQIGDVVSIRKALLGTHRLVTPAGVGLRVRRVR